MLVLLRQKLGYQTMKKMFEEENKIIEQKWRDWVANSNGEYKTVKSVVKAKGLAAAEMMAYHLSCSRAGDQNWQYNGHPDHLGFETTETGPLILKVFGHEQEPLLQNLKFAPCENMPPGVIAYGHDNMLLDGTKIGNISVYIENTEEGCQVTSIGKLAAGAPESLIQGQKSHLDIEIRNWLKRALNAKLTRGIEIP